MTPGIIYTLDIDEYSAPGLISGCDFSGYVVKAGSKVNNVVVGDHVAGFTHGGTYTDRGAFAEYTKVSGDLVLKVPKDTLTHEEASTLACGYVSYTRYYSVSVTTDFLRYYQIVDRCSSIVPSDTS